MFFKILTSRILRSLFRFFLDSGVRKPPLWLNNKLLENFYWPSNNFQLFNITNLGNFLK